MKCVSLDKNCVSQLICHPIFNQEHSGFNEIKHKFKIMYDEQGIEFWTKFIITCRDIFLSKDDLYFLDSVFINFLAAFRNSFEKVCAFVNASNEQNNKLKASLGIVSESSKEFVQLECAAKLSAGFIRMHKLWLASQPGNIHHWKPPKNWIKYEKFEEFLTKLYSVEEFEKQFNCTKDQVPWILKSTNKKTQSKKEMKQKAGVNLHTQFLEKTQKNFDKKTSTSILAKLKRPNTKKIPDELKPPDFPRTTLVWLPPNPETKYLPGNAANTEGFFPLLRETLPNHVRMWDLIEISLPPLLCCKYHTMKVEDLMKKECQSRFMGVATWSAMWFQTFGINYLSKVHELSQECIALQKSEFKKKEEIKAWQVKVDNLLKFVSSTNDLPSEPCYQDNAKKASEFLLEPYVLLQLPWNTVMLHQWLISALVEVIIFEKASLELRHWPLPPHLANITTNLLFAIKKLKQRVALGFAILFKQAIIHPNLDINHPAWIMDEVILPSTATLEFLLSGIANSICKSIKKMAWSDSKKYEESWVFIPESVYTPDFDLQKLILVSCYSCSVWDDTNMIFHPFAFKYCQNLNIKDVIKKISNRQTPEKASNSFTNRNKQMSLMSFRLYQFVMLDRQIPETQTYTQIMDTTLQVLKETVVDPGRLSKMLWPSLVNALTPMSVINSLSNCFNPFAEQLAVHITVLTALAYKRRYMSLVGSEPENSIMARIVKLNLQFTEREYIVRLTLLISNLAEFCPKAINLERYPAMQVSEMIQSLVKLEEEKSKRNRFWLWNQFPSQYRQPVIISKSEMSYKSGIKSIVKCCEDRIGRIVFNVAQSSFDMYEKGGDMFPHWQTVQYVLPCYVANLVEKSEEIEDITNMKNLVKFTHGLIKSYETAFQNWLTGVKLQELTINSMHDLFELHSCSLYYRDLANTYISSYIGLTFPVGDFLYGTITILDTMTEWGKDEQNSEMLPFLKSWYIKTFYHMKNMYDVCLQVFQPPLPGSLVCLPHLSQFYMEEAILHALEHAVIASTRAKTSIQAKLAREMTRDSFNAWRWIFIGRINNSGKHEGDDIDGLSDQQRIEMTSVYEILKMYMKEQGTIEMNLIHLYPSNPAQIQFALQQCKNGNVEELDSMMDLLTNPDKLITMSSQLAQTTSSRGKKRTDIKPKRCCNCPQIEKPKVSFFACQKCIDEKYPDVHYFCSKKCEEACWNNKHKAQHLDFMLGLIGNFDQLSTN